MANLLAGQGQDDEAIRYYRVASQLSPGRPGTLAWLRALAPDPAYRDGAEAVRLAIQACELTGYRKPVFIGTLAAARAEAGDFPSAIATAEWGGGAGHRIATGRNGGEEPGN